MKLYVHGTGCCAGDLIDSVLPTKQVTAFVDSCPHSDSFLGRPVISPEALTEFFPMCRGHCRSGCL